MSNVLEYKGYLGSVEFSAEDQCLCGKVEFINDLILFDGVSVDEVGQSFRDAADQYLESCAARGVQPDQPFKGSFNVRVASKPLGNPQFPDVLSRSRIEHARALADRVTARR